MRLRPTTDTAYGRGMSEVVVAGGCFWCLDAAYRVVAGVHDVVSGYTGGGLPAPSYEQVCTGMTGHAEAVKVVFDENVVPEKVILDMFFTMHDPTQLNRQGNDVGTQYRSAIFYHSPEQKKIAEASKAAAAKQFKKPIVTEITAASVLYPAPVYHQNYYEQNKSKNPYCRFVIEPKLKKLKLAH